MLATEQLWTPQTRANPLELEPSDVVIVPLAHEDDELKVIHGIRNALRFAGEVAILYLTDGEASTRGDPEHLQSQGRRIEAITSLGHFGMSPSDIEFAGLPDGGLTGNPELPSTLSDFMKRREATAILTLGPDPEHPDHHAVHTAAEEVRSRDVRLWGLDTEGKRGVKIVGTRGPKLDVMAHNWSQFTVLNRNEWPDEWEGRPPADWHLVEGRAADSYTYSILLKYGNILLKERYIEYPPDL